MQRFKQLVSRPVLAALLSSVGLASCATKTQTGAVVGTAGGAVVGGVIGRAGAKPAG